MRLGVDAINLLQDQRGMGRYTRAVLRTAIDIPSIAVTLLVRGHVDAGAIEETLARRRFRIAPLSCAQDGAAFDAVWYPWNGMRFRSAAPTLVMMHDVFAFTEPQRDPIARWREQRPIRTAARLATRIATNSAWTREQITHVLGVRADRIIVTPLAPDPFWHPGTEGEPATTGGFPARPFVLFVGGVEPRKNAGFLFDAFAAAFPRREAVLVVVGPLARRDAAHLASLPIDSIREIPNDDRLRALYRRAALVAVPSCAEGYGLVLAEALACGAPAVASSAAALPETADGAALLLPPDDTDAWSTALRRVTFDGSFASQLRARAVARWDGDARTDYAAQTIASLVALSTTPAGSRA
jgi:glycosyltransferase involved in cell wall biosynthesis